MATAAPTAPGYAGMRAVDVIIEWLSTTDHKKIGLLYIFTALGFALVGGAFSLVMRTELAQTGTIIGDETYNQLFTMHGSIMLFLFILPVAAGFMNYIVPLQIGAAFEAVTDVHTLKPDGLPART